MTIVTILKKKRLIESIYDLKKESFCFMVEAQLEIVKTQGEKQLETALKQNFETKIKELEQGLSEVLFKKWKDSQLIFP